MSAEDVLGRLTQQARNEGAQYINGSLARLDLVQLIEDGKAHLIKNVKRDQYGNTIVELYDAQVALIQIGKYHKLFVDRAEVDIPTLVKPVQDLLDKVWGNGHDGNASD
jgi:hypothetical protein